ncbi:TonB-dependent receptor [Sandarakinorhabdus cyanobacteriorum]|uniref:TonB-dependent receptor n=1 Tax=Sandarakinorhabdus cyanobacteriorum TaxID=1981098 RepID=A0A255YBC1_9SPHN|nr:TonB-dependent receptor [Sandarakinorhabdus cyanobacteriorum]OYQ26509.1 TonB-dependent receptor [Sandarakinorhabdus cyanobacteriorum]
MTGETMIAAALLLAAPVAAQTTPPPPADIAATGARAAENAVRQAGDAFGSTVGREVIGIYNQMNVRGFSPIAAGNVRIDGLYFDPVVPPSTRVSRTTTIRVGLSALGSPFPAPTGLVDFGFRRPGSTAAGSALLLADAWGTLNAEVDAVLPASDTLSFGLGASVRLENGLDKTREDSFGGTLIARWTPAPGVTLIPFASLLHQTLDDHRLTFQTATEFLPPLLPRRQRFGPDWVNGSGFDANIGVLADWQLAPQWQLRAGLFRSSRHRDRQMTNLVRGLQPDRTGTQRVIVDPRLAFAAVSGEVRLTRQIDDGPRRHQIHVAVRGRSGDRRFGGSDTLELGPVQIDTPSRVPEPPFRFSAQQFDDVKQITGGIAYEGRWLGVGELAAGLQWTDYKKRIDLPAGGVQATDARLLLYNVTLAANLSDRLVVYAGTVNGLEESGVAPGNAINRNEALPAITTRQFDAGLRFALTDQIKLVAGVFDISKPYFNLDAAGRFDVLGDVVNRGVEASIAGPITPSLSIVAGGVWLWPKVTAPGAVPGRIGERPVGAIGQRFELSADWRPGFAAGLSFDARLAYRSSETATVSNSVAVPARTIIDLGGRYRFKLAGNNALLRVQLSNVFDVEGYDLRGAGAYGPIPGRLAQAYVTIDF